MDIDFCVILFEIVLNGIQTNIFCYSWFRKDE
jgi:hypothetical protein